MLKIIVYWAEHAAVIPRIPVPCKGERFIVLKLNSLTQKTTQGDETTGLLTPGRMVDLFH